MNKLEHEIAEYLIIDPVQHIVELYRLNSNKEYELILKSASGEINSFAIQNLQFPIKAIFDNKKTTQFVIKMMSEF